MTPFPAILTERGDPDYPPEVVGPVLVLEFLAGYGGQPMAVVLHTDGSLSKADLSELTVAGLTDEMSYGDGSFPFKPKVPVSV